MMNPVSLRRTFRAGFLAASMLGATVALSGVAAAQQAVAPRESVITVSGEGRSAIAPDMAVITLSVLKDAKTAREALDANNTAMATVLKALKDGGIAPRDLQTSGFSINPQYTYPNNSDGQNAAPQLIGYQVSNSLTIRVRDLAKVGEIIDQSVTLGINQGGSILFTNDKPEETITEARKAAVADAAAKAKTLAEAAGVKLGRVIDISETFAQPQPILMARSMAKDFAPSAAVPVEGGENNYTVTVTISYGLDQ